VLALECVDPVAGVGQKGAVVKRMIAQQLFEVANNRGVKMHALSIKVQTDGIIAVTTR